MVTIESAFRTVDTTFETIAKVQAKDVCELIREGWRVESAVAVDKAIYYLLRREVESP